MHDPLGQGAKLSGRRVDHLQFVLFGMDALQYRRFRPRLTLPHHRVHHLFGIQYRVERFPFGLDQTAVDCKQVWSKKTAE